MRLIPAEVYSRVVGYFRPTKQWNKGKKAEFKDRKDLKFEEKNTQSKGSENER